MMLCVHTVTFSLRASQVVIFDLMTQNIHKYQLWTSIYALILCPQAGCTSPLSDKLTGQNIAQEKTGNGCPVWGKKCHWCKIPEKQTDAMTWFSLARSLWLHWRVKITLFPILLEFPALFQRVNEFYRHPRAKWYKLFDNCSSDVFLDWNENSAVGREEKKKNQPDKDWNI